MLGLKESPVFPPLPPARRATTLTRLAAMLSEREDVAYAWAHGSSIAGLAFRDIDVAVARRGEAGDDRPSASLDWTFHLADQLSFEVHRRRMTREALGVE